MVRHDRRWAEAATGMDTVRVPSPTAQTDVRKRSFRAGVLVYSGPRREEIQEREIE